MTILFRSFAFFKLNCSLSYILVLKALLYILDDNTLPDMCVANIFSQSLFYLLIFLTVSFTEQKFLILMKSDLLIVSFLVYNFGVVSKKSLLKQISYWFSPMSSSRYFIVLYFTVRCMVYFEFIFVTGARSVSRFTFLYMNILLVQHHLWKHCLFSTVLCLAHCSSELIYLYLHSPVLHYPDYCSCIVSLEVR